MDATVAAVDIARLTEVGACGLTVADLRGQKRSEFQHPGHIRLGVDRRGSCPDVDHGSFDILLTVNGKARAPWVAIPKEALDDTIAQLERVARQGPAASVLTHLLRATRRLAFEDALALESLAYSTLLASDSFKQWRAAHPLRNRRSEEGRVQLFRENGRLHVRLARPAARNAVDAAMRDSLVEALEFALVAPDRAPVVLSGLGVCFSAGGDLDEFGSAPDPALAHLIRVLRSPARLVRQLGRRIEAQLHGPCIGAGIEIPAAAARVVATPNATFRLPEISMGLIPGAGGTVTIPRRIGRHRAAFMAMIGCDFDANRALQWGLIDAVEG